MRAGVRERGRSRQTGRQAALPTKWVGSRDENLFITKIVDRTTPFCRVDWNPTLVSQDIRIQQKNDARRKRQPDCIEVGIDPPHTADKHTTSRIVARDEWAGDARVDGEVGRVGGVDRHVLYVLTVIEPRAQGEPAFRSLVNVPGRCVRVIALIQNRAHATCRMRHTLT